MIKKSLLIKIGVCALLLIPVIKIIAVFILAKKWKKEEK
jgi:hypothetical protein